MSKNNHWLGHSYDFEKISSCITTIKEKFGQQFSDSKSIIEQHTHTMTIHKSELPDGVLFAESKEDISKAVKICHEYGCPIIPFAVGSSFGIQNPLICFSLRLKLYRYGQSLLIL